jgi:hypothetical protein
VKFLKPFYEATLKFSSATHVTSNSYFIQLCIIIKTLSDGCMSCNHILTYLMLSAAENYQKAFTRLGEEDGNHFVVPSYDEWENAREFVKFLKTFYEATLKFFSATHVTSNSYFIQLCICHAPVLGYKGNVSLSNKII